MQLFSTVQADTDGQDQTADGLYLGTSQSDIVILSTQQEPIVEFQKNQMLTKGDLMNVREGGQEGLDERQHLLSDRANRDLPLTERTRNANSGSARQDLRQGFAHSTMRSTSESLRQSMTSQNLTRKAEIKKTAIESPLKRKKN